MFVVAAWVAKIHFTVLNDGIRPVGNVERAVGTQFHVYGAKSYIGAAQQVAKFPRHVARALLLDGKTHHPMRAEIAGDGIALPILGKMPAANDLQSAKFRITAGADALKLPAHVGVSEVGRSRQAEAQALGARAVGHERLAELIELMAPWIAKPAQKNAQLLRGWPQMPDAAAVESFYAVRRFHVAVDVD